MDRLSQKDHCVAAKDLTLLTGCHAETCASPGLGAASVVVRATPAWQTPPSWIGGGPDLLAATAEQGLEGVIAKRTTSTYQPGRRSPSCRKIKNIRTVDVLIGGWSPGGGRRTGTIGSLLVGVSTADGLAYIGNVGSGFTDAALRVAVGSARTWVSRPAPGGGGCVRPGSAGAARRCRSRAGRGGT